jgi:mRNA interferase MazF
MTTTTTRIKPGDVVVARFPGAQQAKRRPGIVVSTDLYHATRPDVTVALVTSQLASAVGPTDFILSDWPAAGLRRASAFQAYFHMFVPALLRLVGHLTDRDWREVQARLRLAIAVT